MLLRFAYILNDAVALAPNSTTRRRRLESGEDDCNDGATTSRAVRTMALRRESGTETSVARRRARSKEQGATSVARRRAREADMRWWSGAGPNPSVGCHVAFFCSFYSMWGP